MVDFYKTSEDVINEAAKRYKKSFKLNENKLYSFKQYCYALQADAEKMNIESVSFSIDSLRKDMHVTLITKDFVMYGHANYLYEVIRRAKRFNLNSTKSKKLEIEFVFDNLFVKKDLQK